MAEPDSDRAGGGHTRPGNFGRGWLLRCSGITAGVATHVLFAGTVWYLVWFLHGDSLAAPVVHAATALGIDLLLALQFALLHSLLLHPAVRQSLTRFIPRPFYGLFFCVTTCLSLLGLFAGWRSAEADVWRLDGPARIAMETAFVACWGALLYALYLSGFGYQTGFTPWWFWVRGAALPNREFRPRSLYRLLRHPVYLSFMGLIWLNPVMTLDRMLLAVIWSAYIFVGSVLKDRRMAYFLGETYHAYEMRVPGYPFLLTGPLARRLSEPAVVAGTIAEARPFAATARRAA